MVSLPDSSDDNYQTPPEQHSQNSPVTNIAVDEAGNVVDLDNDTEEILDDEKMVTEEEAAFDTEELIESQTDAHHVFDEMPEREQEASKRDVAVLDRGKRKLPVSMDKKVTENGERGGECSSKHDVFKETINRVLKMLVAEGRGKGCDDGKGVDFLETAKRKGVTFPRPRWRSAQTWKGSGHVAKFRFTVMVDGVSYTSPGTFQQLAVNKIYGGTITFPGICVTWGLIVMSMIYAVGHISAHFNPAVTITLSLLGLLPYKEVIPYIIVQLLGSILASGTLSLIMDVTPEAFFGTTPVGSTIQSFVVEIIITFILMFVISGASNDHRAIKKHGGIVVGMTIMLNVFVGGPISGASMNPARSIGPALVKIAVNKIYGGTITFPGICVTWGLIVMSMIYAVGHVSAHFNPAVTITLSLLGLLPYKEVVPYIIVQLLGSILASGTLSLIMNVTPEAFFGTTPVGSTIQSFVVEIIITFILMFVISGASNDHRAHFTSGTYTSLFL
ncbi:Aquaporin-like protein [Artemisia annua]|uniref:Aquaporin-like protein n=1 Tax=Artemisia annua TaxID=35608 RepID=A0A2U1NPJ5_ARTAN|nr:Aquaporin-like protein [Artemisia annua]